MLFAFLKLWLTSGLLVTKVLAENDTDYFAICKEKSLENLTMMVDGNCYEVRRSASPYNLALSQMDMVYDTCESVGGFVAVNITWTTWLPSFRAFVSRRLSALVCFTLCSYLTLKLL